MKESLNYETYWKKGMSYDEYIAMIDALLARNMTTGPNQSEELVAYTDLNVKRMKRIHKSYDVEEQLEEAMKEKAGIWGVLVITEGWCGDAAQIVPVIDRATQKAGMETRFLLRDEHTELIDAHLTNGGRSIPILLFIDLKSMEVKDSWGPRPAPAQKLVMDYKAAPEPKPPYEEFVKQVQLWYAKDKQRSMEDEWLDKL